MNEFRLSQGGRIDRSRPLRFTFEGKALKGYSGDSLASALLANGIHFVGRSYKLHRPRGIMSAGSEEAAALVGIDRGPGRFDPNIRATTQPLYDGLDARAQHCWPSLKWDAGEVARLASPLFSAGFYYKTFMWPAGFWKRLYEPALRKSAGLGRAPVAPDPDDYASSYMHCDLLIVGAGPAGIATALERARDPDLKIVLVDEQDEMGGCLLSDRLLELDGQGPEQWLEQATNRLNELPNVTLLSRTTAFGYYEDNMLGLTCRLSDHLSQKDRAAHPDLPRERGIRVRAGAVVLATGAMERPLSFNGNDRPGIMLASAVRTYLHRYAVIPGKKCVVATDQDSAWYAAFDLAGAGVEVPAIVDLRRDVSASLVEMAQRFGIRVLIHHEIANTTGRFRVSALRVRSLDGTRKKSAIPCDTVLMSGGWTPTVHLFSQSRGKLKWHQGLGAAVPEAALQNVTCVGACNGDLELVQLPGVQIRNGTTDQDSQRSADASGSVRTTKIDAGAFIDFQHDVKAGDIELAVREGFHSIEHIKRYTTTGMASDQGKTSNINALNVAAHQLGRSMAEIGLTTFRPPYTPVTFGALAGQFRNGLLEPVRTAPTHSWAKENGAIFEPIGQWRRARYFPKKGETMQQAVARECVATRNAIGISDASTLGKIEVVGPDAAEFLNRFYTNPLFRLPVGKCRYVLALGEDGFIYDDGIVARLAPDRFHVTTTTGGAARVFVNMQDYLQTEWTDLNVWLTSITEQWGVIALNGPRARRLLGPLVGNIDLDAGATPHMSIREGEIFGVPLRLFRVSFTGETGFELNVPARFANQVFERLMAAGQAYGICPYGTETLHHLRAEKGYMIVGQDLEGGQTPADMGLTWAIGKNKREFIGKRSLLRPDMLAPDRLQFVGLRTKQSGRVLEEGAQLVDLDSPKTDRSQGYVTSAYASPCLGHSIALALVRGGLERMGERLECLMPSGNEPVTIVSPVFYDPDGTRLNMDDEADPDAEPLNGGTQYV